MPQFITSLAAFFLPFRLSPAVAPNRWISEANSAFFFLDKLRYGRQFYGAVGRRPSSGFFFPAPLFVFRRFVASQDVTRDRLESR